MTLDEAIAKCTSSLNESCPAGKFAYILPDEKELIEDCARDQQVGKITNVSKLSIPRQLLCFSKKL